MPAPYDLFDYQQYWQGREYEDTAEKIAIERFFKIIGEKSSLIDVGGGFGRLTEAYLNFSKKVVLTDPSENNLIIAKKKFGKNGKIIYRKASLPDLPFADCSFDVVIMVRVIHHLADSQKNLKELSRILKPNGYLILEFANKIHFLARIKALLKGEFNFAPSLKTYEKRSKESISKKKILFLNHHPKKIFIDLQKNDFKILDYLSVSNFRSPIIKRIIPFKLLIFLENICQRWLSNVFFGPSIFVLAKKSHNT